MSHTCVPAKTYKPFHLFICRVCGSGTEAFYGCDTPGCAEGEIRCVNPACHNHTHEVIRTTDLVRSNETLPLRGELANQTGHYSTCLCDKCDTVRKLA